jgi:hypothetical protein
MNTPQNTDLEFGEMRIHESREGSHFVASIVAPRQQEGRLLSYAKELADQIGLKKPLIQVTPLQREEGLYLLTVTRVN